MITIYIIFGLYTIIIWWGYVGYFLFLHTRSKQNQIAPPLDLIKDYPTIAVLVPCLNEESIIREKIKNVQMLKYPQDKLKVYFLDGGSTDQTCSIIRAAASQSPYIFVINTHCTGKIPQLNSILPMISSDIIVNTDVDGILEENTLLKIVARFKADPKIGVVGATVTPGKTPNLERSHWETQNWIRNLESQVYSSSVVVAICYAFKREILDQFPDDVIADDVYISFISNLKGYKSIYASEILATETRAPANFSTIILHKFRKTHANIVETLRFFLRSTATNRSWLVIFYTRALQILFLPIFSAVYFAFLVFLLVQGHSILSFAGMMFLGVSFLLYPHFHRTVHYSSRIYSIYNTFANFILLNILLSFSLIIYPFLSHSSNYQRINS
ncbi:MAG: hypothetical protein A2161_11455 [Candidatus Schekmanbacteria bacterium RBG_13_48_7]|uniref:Glycosyltransferase 2-like domain-containing protein n=1 Tax=Candidatus Schekmanbacteria bacterium RBG_13_48_7 TaxID=1817878 RepID=A0A1F7RWN5_9BACT|nr:MAG: hypothetical protein A2161_11455 [Candidatus Schekmanbacteria bacterium RBG_13_48_7]